MLDIALILIFLRCNVMSPKLPSVLSSTNEPRESARRWFIWIVNHMYDMVVQRLTSPILSQISIMWNNPSTTCKFREIDHAIQASIRK